MDENTMTMDTATGQLGLFDGKEEQEQFLDKFKPKLTTDDCYTPANVYEAVKEWVLEEYRLPEDVQIVRPFWPGGDFLHEDYPDGCVVIDNPPFSIRSAILEYYCSMGIRFFLFSPALTLLTSRRDVCHIAAGVNITYENGAEVRTAFVTNLESCAIRTAPDLQRRVDEENKKNLREMRRDLPKYAFPDEIVTAAIVDRWAKYGVEYRLDWSDCVFIRSLESMREEGKAIYGGGLLLNERAAAHRWTISPREYSLVNGKEGGGDE